MSRDVSAKVKEFKHRAGIETRYVDLTVHFIGARGLPRTDVAGSSDPYFIARLDREIEYTYARPACRLLSATLPLGF